MTYFNDVIGKYAFLLLSIIYLAAGCSPKTSTTTLPIKTPESFSNTGEVPLEEEWWSAFDDPQLDQLVQTALDSNFTIRSAWQRVKAAEAVVDRETSNFWPDIQATAQSGLSRPEPDFVGGENVQLGLSASYEIDLWGRFKTAVQAERYRSQASMFDYQTAAISISAEVAITYFQLQTAWNLLELSNEQITTNENIMRLIRARFGIGQIRGVDILRQRQLLRSTYQLRYALESQIAVLEHQLLVLLGQPPQEEINYLTDTLPPLPPLPETGIPADLIRRRPDVGQAFSQLNAADREVASAISAQYPRITIGTSYALRSNNFQDLWSQWAYSLAGGITAPLFYGGRLSAEVDRTKAVKQQLLFDYGQTVLIALQEVENALVQEQQQLSVIETLEDQVEIGTRAYEQLQVEYFNGLSDYLVVLTELTQVQQLQRDLLNARLLLIQFRVNLYRALAGGFEMNREQES